MGNRSLRKVVFAIVGSTMMIGLSLAVLAAGGNLLGNSNVESVSVAQPNALSQSLPSGSSAFHDMVWSPDWRQSWLVRTHTFSVHFTFHFRYVSPGVLYPIAE